MKRIRSAARSDPAPDERAKPRRAHIGWLVGLAIFACLAAYTVQPLFVKPSSNSRLLQARAALTASKFAEAERLAEQILADEPTASQALLIAAYAAAGQNRVSEAMDHLERIPDDGTEYRLTALVLLGELAIRQGYALRAEDYLRQAVNDAPGHVPAREALINLLVMEDRTYEARQLILPMLKSGRFRFDHLIVASSPEIWLADVSEFTAKCLAARPGDLLPLLPVAGEARRNNNPQKAKDLLKQIVVAHPENSEVQAQLGMVLAGLWESAAFVTWHEALPESATEHPLVWIARGEWAEHNNQPQGAARCYWEAILRHPNHTAANYQLSQVLVNLQEPELAKPFAERAGVLTRLFRIVQDTNSNWDPEKIRELVELLVELGRPWEAISWCKVLRQKNQASAWVSDMEVRLSDDLANCPDFTLGSHNPALQQSLAHYPLPTFKRSGNGESSDPQQEHLASAVRFSDSAREAGIPFTYHNGSMDKGRESLFEMNGGGVAVLDYDNDGWPDLYLTQGGNLPPQPNDSPFTDRLFRNRGNGQFQDVTSYGGVGDVGYSQGVTVGDVDNDGFADIYVANIGSNRLYINNGDGTFRDATSAANAGSDRWTSSCLLADLNGDGLPDLYTVNYLAGEDLTTRICKKQAGKRCAPVDFPAAQDQLFVNLGDGRFEEATEQAGVVAMEGRGLGIVAADLDGSHRLSLFIANDMSANFLFANQTDLPGQTPSFVEQGVLSGVALNAQGDAEACMGIAAGDANEDGLLDLFVTNFYHEANNLFMQQSQGLFRDQARHANLSSAGYELLGWGTQFLDADLDGRLDLIVANGHVHDPLDPAVPFRMPAQYFGNVGNGKFVLASPESLGEYFQEKHLGRALATLDWNRDGLPDVCISHLDSPASLLTNQTSQPGHYLSVRLVGVISSRDAIGTTVRLQIGEQTLTRQLTAGDGFQASNQRHIIFGLGDASRVDRLDVHWPSGRTDELTNLPANQEILVIEGSKEAIASRIATQ